MNLIPFFCMWTSSFPAPLIGDAFFLPMYFSGIFVKYQTAVVIGNHLWIFDFITSI